MFTHKIQYLRNKKSETMLIGREKEKRILQNALNEELSQFIAVYGRRRVGKTFLIREAYNYTFHFQFTGAANTNARKQLARFRMALKEHGLTDVPNITNWMDAFSELKRFISLLPEGKKVIFLDELPWMDAPRSGFLAELESFWNGWASARKDIVFVVCGSSTAWMVKKIIKNKGGLHNRLTHRIALKPFTLHWCEQMMKSRGIALTRKQLLELVQGFKGNLTSTTEGIKGVTNYTLQIKSAKSDAAAAVLYVFDSNSYSPNKRAKGYEWIAHNQIGWYIEQSAAYTAANEGNPLPALAFFHIPLPEYNEAVKTENSFMVGTRKEPACSPKINSGLAAAMLEAGDVMGVFVGHDHINDYAVDWRGILLAYGRYTGGDTVYNNMPNGNGARVIELTEGARDFRTWIRIKDGKVLNELHYPNDIK